MGISILFFLYVLSGIGYFCFGLSRRKEKRLRRDDNPYQLITIPSIGFAIAYSSYCLIYFAVIFLGNASLELVTHITIGFSSIGLILFAKFHNSLTAQSATDYKTSVRQIAICLPLLFFLIALPQIILGDTPFLVSDSWSHVSIINRMLNTKVAYLSSFSMPNDHYLLKYSPHHAFLASIAYLSNSSALDAFKEARYFFPIILVSAYLFYIQNVGGRWATGTLTTVFAITIFSLVFPTTDGVWRGSADYRIPAFILMFLLAGFVYQIYIARESFRPSYIVPIAMGALCIAVTHVIEIAFLTVMLVPFGFFLSVKLKSKEIALRAALALLIFTFAGLAGFLLAKGAYTPLNKSITYSDFVKYYLQQLETHIGFYTWGISAIAAIFASRLSRSSDQNVSRFLLVTLISSLVLGPLNPILFPAYNYLMGSSHSNRIMHAFPFYFSLTYLISVAAYDLKGGADTKKKLLLVSCMTLVVSAVAVNVYKASGLNGNFTYLRNDSLSQLCLYPDFYSTIRERYQYRVIASDTYTSAPVNAVSSNYVFTNRPWTGGKDNRFELSKIVMKNPASPEAIKIICEYGIDVIAINRNDPPEEFKKLFQAFSWLKADFKSLVTNNDLSHAAGFNYYGAVDKVDIFEVDRNVLCK